MGRTTTPARTENPIVHYLRDTRAEIGKVTWPTREEGLRLTWVVTVVTVIAAIVLFGVDSLFSLIITAIVTAL